MLLFSTVVPHWQAQCCVGFRPMRLYMLRIGPEVKPALSYLQGHS